MPLNKSNSYLPSKVQEQELWPKISEMTDYIISNAITELKDVSKKYSGPEEVRNEAIKQIIDEIGFKYISEVMETLDNFEFNTLLSYISLINLLKGHRDGLELVLNLLGFDAIINEWWEQEPKGEPWTYEIVIIMNSSFVEDPILTLDRLQVFARHYVYPLIENIDFKFAIPTFSLIQITTAGFVKQKFSGRIIQKIT